MTDCNKIQANNIACNEISLTEQWKKGELPSGEYYIIDDLGLHTTDRYYPSYGFGAELPQAVLAPVPSYEEWPAKIEENAQLKETVEALESELKQVCDVLIRKCPEMKEWVMLNWKNLYEVKR